MSTISRRDFMKTAGVMTLAVAASAALAGCSTDDIQNGAQEVVLTQPEKNTLQKNNAANAANKNHGNGETVTFAHLNHKITISTKIYNYKEIANGLNYGAFAVSTVTIASGDERTVGGDVKAQQYQGQWAQGDYRKANIVMNVGGVSALKSSTESEVDHYVDVATHDSEYEKELKEKFTELLDAAKASNKANGTDTDADMNAFVQSNDIPLYGQSYTTVVVLPHNHTNKVSATFTNYNYMEKGSEIVYNYTVTPDEKVLDLE